jgi:proline iminopeptidase
MTVIRPKSATTIAICVALICACAGDKQSPLTGTVNVGFIESSDGIELFYGVYGSGEDTLYVIHGGPGLDHQYLLPDLEALEDSHTLIAYDQRGAGRSTVVADPSLLTLDAHLADLDAVRKYFGTDRAAFLGHSWGALLIARYALDYPERAAKLVLASPGPIRLHPYDEQFFPHVTAWMGDSELAELDKLMGAFENPDAEIRAACRDFFSLFKRGYFHDVEDPVALREMHGEFCTGTEDGIRNLWTVNSFTLESLGNHDWRYDFDKIDIPVLVITGVSDVFPVDNFLEWEAAFPNSELVLIESAGHYPHVEQPGYFFDTVGKFLR